ncbi:hypothetical protein HPP92_009675 [Vanilla planifolia]|uniref:Late embryogenesis abundant protein n=1 Tax=Vanilla planifolia TaxID=51239 RepID=A0A835RAH2_VANPL|nr:hypothetical protein HPP92_009675 [Vanilla planifolia]
MSTKFGCIIIVLAVLSSSSPAVDGFVRMPSSTEASKTAGDAGRAAESWADWAREKVFEGIGRQHDNAKMAAEHAKAMAGSIVTDAKEKAFEAADYGSEKAGKARDATAHATSEAKEAAKEKVEDAESVLRSREEDALKAYGDAKRKVGDTYESAKESMASAAKREYEVAKEKASEAAGNLGASLRPEEL